MEELINEWYEETSSITIPPPEKPEGSPPDGDEA